MSLVLNSRWQICGLYVEKAPSLHLSNKGTEAKQADKVGSTEKRFHGKRNITEYWVANKTPLKLREEKDKIVPLPNNTESVQMGLMLAISHLWRC